MYFSRVQDMIADLDNWEKWRWPNSDIAILWNPILLPFFKPHNTECYAAISCWLELALKTGNVN